MSHDLDLTDFPIIFELVIAEMPATVADGWRTLFAAEPGLEMLPVDDDGWMTVAHRGVTVMQLHADTFAPDATDGAALIMVDGQPQEVALCRPGS